MSASLNTVAGTLYEDFIAPIYKKSPKSDATASLLMKGIVLLVGTISVVLIFVVERLGGIMQMAMSLTSITHGAMIYIFSVGLFFPWVTSQGALWGAVASLCSMAWIAGGSQYYMLIGRLRFPGKITTIDQCPLDYNTGFNYFNSTTSLLNDYIGVGSPVVTDEVPQMFQLSYMYFCAVGTMVGLLVGLVVSYVTEPQDLASLNPNLITPWMRNFLPPSKPTLVEEELKLIKAKNAVQITINGVS